jgi:hypothetical protein
MKALLGYIIRAGDVRLALGDSMAAFRLPSRFLCLNRASEKPDRSSRQIPRENASNAADDFNARERLCFSLGL